ncbi:hypothetical protein R20233_01049 [Ralstonia sp. LMG 32965]|uniref:c-type cytochrome n=1 Tax=Ralstonia flatus TaxID=3058601 RepID=UPI0028F664E0|nr:c-type cytochrome [Ralstonia sp. LMG 32965]CAJ0863394.1 hypothetical protein R20233_01049 [Ralstonia sp. LMG 32965]
MTLMKLAVLPMFAVLSGMLVMTGHAAPSSSEETCRACHTMDTTKVGPPFRSIAERYQNDPDAIAKLKKSMLEGSSGKWGAGTMPPNAITPEEADRFAHWVMQLKPAKAK